MIESTGGSVTRQVLNVGHTADVTDGDSLTVTNGGQLLLKELLVASLVSVQPEALLIIYGIAVDVSLTRRHTDSILSTSLFDSQTGVVFVLKARNGGIETVVVCLKLTSQTFSLNILKQVGLEVLNNIVTRLVVCAASSGTPPAAGTPAVVVLVV